MFRRHVCCPMVCLVVRSCQRVAGGRPVHLSKRAQLSTRLHRSVDQEKCILFFSAVALLQSHSLVSFFQALAVPWRSILFSLPVWATVVAHFAENWGFYTLLTQLPSFLNGIPLVKFCYINSSFNLCCYYLDTSQLKIDKTGFLAAIPYLVMSIIVQFGGQIADWLRSRWQVETTKVS